MPREEVATTARLKEIKENRLESEKRSAKPEYVHKPGQEEIKKKL